MVASRESQYKIFHFHHGGLDKLSEVFQQWKFCTETHLRDQVAQPDSGAGRGWLWWVWICPSTPSLGVSGSGDSPLRSMAFGHLWFEVVDISVLWG